MPTPITQTIIENDLKKIGLTNGDIVNVHSSMKSIGQEITGGPQTVIQALINVLGPQGTLLMPVFCKPESHINLRDIPSRLGLITETFRNWPGVQRSNDPTHSVAAIGAAAEDLLKGHEDVPPLGMQSPLHKAALQGGKTLHLGTDLRSCSLIHIAESIAQAPYLDIGYTDFHKDHQYIGYDGVQRLKIKSEAPGDSNGFMKIHQMPSIVAARRSGVIGNAPSELYHSESLLNACVDIISDDPFSVLCDNEKCSVCSRRHARKQS